MPLSENDDEDYEVINPSWKKVLIASALRFKHLFSLLKVWLIGDGFYSACGVDVLVATGKALFSVITIIIYPFSLFYAKKKGLVKYREEE